MAEFIRTYITTQTAGTRRSTSSARATGASAARSSCRDSSSGSTSASTASSSSRRRSTWGRCRSTPPATTPRMRRTCRRSRRPPTTTRRRGATGRASTRCCAGRGVRRRRYLAACSRATPCRARRRSASRARRAYTGLSKDYVLRSDLRIYAPRFTKELCGGREVGGLLEGRYAQDELDDVDGVPERGDPFSAKDRGPATCRLSRAICATDLKVDFAQRYVGLSEEANGAGSAGQRRRLRRIHRSHRPAGAGDEGQRRVARLIGRRTRPDDVVFGDRVHAPPQRHRPGRMTIKDYEGGHMMSSTSPRS